VDVRGRAPGVARPNGPGVHHGRVLPSVEGVGTQLVFSVRRAGTGAGVRVPRRCEERLVLALDRRL
jgi:hypothetical protein